MPVVAVLAAVIFFGESLTFWQVSSGILVLLGIWISIQKKSRTSIEQVAETPPVS